MGLDSRLFFALTKLHSVQLVRQILPHWRGIDVATFALLSAPLSRWTAIARFLFLVGSAANRDADSDSVLACCNSTKTLVYAL